MLASLLFPYDDDAGDLMPKWLDELANEDCIRLYEHSGSQYLEITKWKAHQKIDKPSKPQFPGIEDISEDTREVSRQSRERSSEEGKGKEGIGEEGKGEDAGEVDGERAKPSDAEALLTAYHDILPACQRVTVMNPKRKRRIADAVKLARALCKSQGWNYNPTQFWTAYFGECVKDPWLRGEVSNPKNSSWRQNIDVLLAEDRFAKLMDNALDSMRGDA